MEEKETLKERFDKKGFGVNKYARANKLERSTLSRVLNEELNGEKSSLVGNTRKVICALKRDEVWVGSLPWESAS